MDLLSAFSDPELCKGLLRRLETAMSGNGGRRMRFMEVCGTHTVAIFQSGLKSLLPAGVEHVSGPGCPVCVTHDAEIALCQELAGRDKIILATFGDMLRVPGPDGGTLKHARAAGAKVEMVYSPLDALRLAEENTEYNVVFLGIGFETTAPAVAGALLTAARKNIDNFMVLSFHKLVPPALRALLAGGECDVDAFLLPGHVSTILGLEPYEFLAKEFARPAAVGGFEPADILLALCVMAEQTAEGRPEITNAYRRAVSDQGNAKARAIMDEVFIVKDALWRGLGTIQESGLAIAPAFARFDAMQRLDLALPEVKTKSGCRCGSVLKGIITPNQCALFAKNCTTEHPVGPCMVSTEGSCAAWYKYNLG